MLFATKVKFAAALLVGLVFAGLAVGQVGKFLAGATTAQLVSPSGNAGGNDSSTSQPSDFVIDKNTVDLGNGELIEFVGTSPFGKDDWHDMNGQPINTPKDLPNYRSRLNPAPTMRLAVRITAPDSVQTHINTGAQGGMGTWAQDNNGADLHVMNFTPKDADETEISVDVADGQWKTLLNFPIRRGNFSLGGKDFELSMAPFDQNGKVLLCMSVFTSQPTWRATLTDAAGKEYIGKQQGGGSTEHTSLDTFLYDLPIDQMKSMRFQTRGYNKHATVSHMSISPDHPTTAQISVKED